MRKGHKILLLSALTCLVLVLACWLGWTWYDGHVDRSGWLERDGVTMYADFYGDPVTGWQTIAGNRYYFTDDHAMHTGWLNTEQGRCYFGEDGALCTHWQTIGDDRYYFDPQGILQTGWVDLEGERHYFRQDGTLASLWQKTEEGTYFLDENGTPVTGWLTWEQARFCLDEQGLLQTGWQTLEGKQYYFGETGAAHTGWLDTGDSRYYFDEDCVMVTGWQTIDGSRYYFSENGSQYTGWLTEGEYRYYLLPEGTLATGRQQIDGKTCYFTPDGIWVLLVNPWNPLPKAYAPELVETEDGFLVDALCLEPLETMMAAMREEGLLPMFSSAYRSKTHQANIWQNYVNRYMASGYSEAQANSMTASYVAVPGTSEHHTGLALDIVGYDYFFDGHYGSTKAVQAWLAEHCWEYGFILRYTKEKQPITGFAAETWHFRYVGTRVSMAMKDSGLCLEEYLGATNPK